MNIAKLQQEPFHSVSEMESPLITVHDLLLAIGRVANTLDNEEDATIIIQLVGLSLSHIRTAEILRTNLFRLTHPKREHFEQHGWPGQEKGEVQP